MRKDYELQTDVLSTIVASTPVTRHHADLLTAFATRSDYRAASYVMLRDTFGEQPARVLDADGGEVSSDYRAWIDGQLQFHGSARAVWEAHKDAGYWLSEVQPVLLYFVHDRGGEQDAFVQIGVWQEQEFVERELLPRNDRWGLPDESELRRGSATCVERAERRLIGKPRYRLDEVVDMQRFTAIAEAVFRERRRADGDRRVTETNFATGEQRMVTVRELTPGYDQQRWPGRRFFDDWSESSAGVVGERACKRWTFRVSDYTDHLGARHLDFVPQWAHPRKVLELKDTQKLDVYSLFGKLKQFDERIGMPFAWYFYGLHGNLIKSGQMERALEAAEAGLIVLPENDYRVLRRWGDVPYGF